jgi:hypothetical protein
METNNPESQHNPGLEHTPKPLPIYIQNVTSIPPLLQLLEQVAAKYEIKALADNQVKVQPATTDSYREKNGIPHIQAKRRTFLQSSAQEHALFHSPCRYQDRNREVRASGNQHFEHHTVPHQAPAIHVFCGTQTCTQ